MSRIRKTTGSKVIRRMAPLAFVAAIGLGAAACGSSGSKTNVQNSPTPTTAPAATSPATTAPQSGGAGF